MTTLDALMPLLQSRIADANRMLKDTEVEMGEAVSQLTPVPTGDKRMSSDEPRSRVSQVEGRPRPGRRSGSHAGHRPGPAAGLMSATAPLPVDPGPRFVRKVATYQPSTAFARQLNGEVEGYFASTGKSKRDAPGDVPEDGGHAGRGWPARICSCCSWSARAGRRSLGAVSLGLAMAGVGFNIQHDANHGAYSRHAWVNRIMSLTLDLLGGTAYFWHFKHNIAHHTHPNIAGQDDDISLGVLGRVSPAPALAPVPPVPVDLHVAAVRGVRPAMAAGRRVPQPGHQALVRHHPRAGPARSRTGDLLGGQGGVPRPWRSGCRCWCIPSATSSSPTWSRW